MIFIEMVKQNLSDCRFDILHYYCLADGHCEYYLAARSQKPEKIQKISGGNSGWLLWISRGYFNQLWINRGKFIGKIGMPPVASGKFSILFNLIKYMNLIYILRAFELALW